MARSGNDVRQSRLVSPGVRVVRSDEVSAETAQTAGMQRYAAISGASVGSQKLWMGRTHYAPSTRTADHHHGEAETAIYVVSGRLAFAFLDGDAEKRHDANPGDFILVPPYIPHREENLSADDEAVIIVARSSQDAIVVNMPSLWAEVKHAAG